MKRKFGFNITTSKHAAKAEIPPTVLRPPSPVYSYHRRELPPNVEAELREACAVILQNFKPSSQMYEEQILAATFADIQKSNYGTEQRSGEARRGQARKPSDGHTSAELPLPLDTRKYRYKPESALKDLFEGTDRTHTLMQVGTRRQQDLSQQETPLEPLAPAATATNRSQRDFTRPSRVKTPVYERPRTSNRGESYDTSSSTPRTVASDYHSASTALTSALQTPSGSSKRASKHMAFDARSASGNRADAAAAQWMRQELDKRGRRSESQERPPSRASIRSGIAEYFRPSLSLSRSSSRDSSLQQAPARPSTATGWRSWSLTRKKSNTSLRDSRSSSVRGRKEGKGDEPREVNLNRELPPLPGLDTYDEKQALPRMHIAALMRPKKSRKPEPAQPADEHFAERGRSTTAQRRTDYQRPVQPTNPDVSKPNRHVLSTTLPEASKRMPFLDTIPPPPNMHDITRPSTAGGSRERTKDRFSDKSSSQMSHSRHISLGHYSTSNPSVTSVDQAFRNAFHINSTKSNSGKQSRSRSRSLAKIFGRNKKDQKDWMTKVEKLGVRGGLIEEFGHGSPIVRY